MSTITLPAIRLDHIRSLSICWCVLVVSLYSGERVCFVDACLLSRWYSFCRAQLFRIDRSDSIKVIPSKPTNTLPVIVRSIAANSLIFFLDNGHGCTKEILPRRKRRFFFVYIEATVSPIKLSVTEKLFLNS